MLPTAWHELAAEAHELIVDRLADKTEALSGYRPASGAVRLFLRMLVPGSGLVLEQRKVADSPGHATTKLRATQAPVADRTVRYTYVSQGRTSPDACKAPVKILRELAARDPSRLPMLADAVRTRRMSQVAPGPEQINPRNPAIARAVQLAPGWMAGLNINDRTKMTIIRAACEVWRVRVPRGPRDQYANG